MIIRTLLIALLCLSSACTGKGKSSQRIKETEVSLDNHLKQNKNEKKDHVCEISVYPVSDNDMLFHSIYEVPVHCFEPHVSDPDITIQNQRRKKFLNIIGVMKVRPQHETGAQMLDFCWENNWKWDHFPEDQRPDGGSSICNVPQRVTMKDVEIVKEIERCRLECLGERAAFDPY